MPAPAGNLYCRESDSVGRGGQTVTDSWDGWRVIADYHTHTRHSHGTGSVLDNARAAARRGLEAVGIADHGPAMYPWLGVGSARTYDRIREEAADAARRTGVKVITAAECNIIGPDGELDLSVRDLRKLDLVLAGLHLMVVPVTLAAGASLLLPNMGPWRWLRRVRERARATNTKALVEAVRRHPIDIVAHPGLMLPVDTPELARACAARGTRMEISSFHRGTDEAYVRAAARQGADFVLSSDAHSPARVGDLDAALRVARRAGLSPERVMNAAGV